MDYIAHFEHVGTRCIMALEAVEVEFQLRLLLQRWQSLLLAG